jgi:hypothetical protein
MGKIIKDYLNTWMEGRSIGDHQIDNQGIIWRSEAYSELQEKLLFGRSNLYGKHIFMDLVANSQKYVLPLGTSDVRPPNGLKDFANMTKLEISYSADSSNKLAFFEAEEVDSGSLTQEELELTPETKPRYFFDGKESIIIFPKPKKTLTSAIYIHYNYFDVELTVDDDESKMNIPFYFIKLMYLYLDFCWKRYRTSLAEAQMEYAIREKKLWETVGLLNQKAV